MCLQQTCVFDYFYMSTSTSTSSDVVRIFPVGVAKFLGVNVPTQNSNKPINYVSKKSSEVHKIIPKGL